MHGYRNMTNYVSQKKAAEILKISRPTLDRHRKQGRVSAEKENGVWKFDLAELARVYPDKKMNLDGDADEGALPDMHEVAPESEEGAGANQDVLKILREHNEFLQSQLEEKDRQMAEKDKQLNSINLQIEDQRSKRDKAESEVERIKGHANEKIENYKKRYEEQRRRHAAELDEAWSWSAMWRKLTGSQSNREQGGGAKAMKAGS